MCGICGIVSTNPGSIPGERAVERMRDTLVHRGPDSAGLHLGSGVALGSRRLSIVDVEHGRQPMYSEDRRYVIVYNGEVFNHPTLQRELESAGVRYDTRADTETVLHLFTRFGDGAVDRLRGMFAFAVWDSMTRELFLARDRLGIKPLYYAHRSNGDLLFASEMKALFTVPGCKPTLNQAALPDFLANHAPSGEDTLFEGIRRLAPGHTLRWRNGTVQIRRYWDLTYGDPAPPPRRGSAAEVALVDEYRQRLTEAVRLRLMSDVPLGMFLSGGIDSAAITATMATLVAEPIQTFSVAFAERQANELAYARLVAQRYQTDHREIIVSPEQFFAELPHLTWHEDEPIAHPSSIALYFVSKLASEHVKVVLTGEGSDETLAGYNRYRVTDVNMRLGAAYRRALPSSVRRGVSALIRALPLTSRGRQRASRTFLMRTGDLDDLYFDNFAVFGRAAQRDLLAEPVRDSIGAVDPYAAHHAALERVPGRPLISRLLYADTSTYLHELLMKQDQMSMAASIESRVPFLDHPFVEWVAALPPSLKLRGMTTKWILRAAMRGRLPQEVIHRRKMGFPVPVGEWFRGRWRPIVDDVVLGERLRRRSLFDHMAVRRLVEEHAAGVNHAERLWALLTFEVWARIFLDGEAPSAIRSSLNPTA